MAEAIIEAFPIRSSRESESRAVRMSERSEFRSRLEERWGNGVNNLNGSEAMPNIS
jgi:hypothetical protein